MGGLITLGEFSVSDILPLIGCHTEKSFITSRGEYFARLNSARMLCFKRSIFCVSCLIPGTHFRLEQHENKGNNSKPDRAHLNMYNATNPKYILMTKDHIIPESWGGTDNLENLQTMCTLCNQKKGNIPNVYSVRYNSELLYVKAFTKKHALTITNRITNNYINQLSIDDIQLLTTIN
jgi:hypothetical protein